MLSAIRIIIDITDSKDSFLVASPLNTLMIQNVHSSLQAMKGNFATRAKYGKSKSLAYMLQDQIDFTVFSHGERMDE